jgi:hypothetical protein
MRRHNMIIIVLSTPSVPVLYIRQDNGLEFSCCCARLKIYITFLNHREFRLSMTGFALFYKESS